MLGFGAPCIRDLTVLVPPSVVDQRFRRYSFWTNTVDMSIRIKFPVSTHTHNIYFLYKHNVYTLNETWPSISLPLPGNTDPWNLSAFARIANHLAIARGISSSNWVLSTPLQWRHNEHDDVSNHQPRDCLLNRLFRHTWKKTSKFRVTGLCVGNSPVTGEFPAQGASNAENASIWWRHHEMLLWDSLIYGYHRHDYRDRLWIGNRTYR